MAKIPIPIGSLNPCVREHKSSSASYCNFAKVDWRHNRTVKPCFNAPKNQEHSICFKPDAQLVLVIEWAAKGANIKIESFHTMSINVCDYHMSLTLNSLESWVRHLFNIDTLKYIDDIGQTCWRYNPDHRNVEQR